MPPSPSLPVMRYFPRSVSPTFGMGTAPSIGLMLPEVGVRTRSDANRSLAYFCRAISAVGSDEPRGERCLGVPCEARFVGSAGARCFDVCVEGASAADSRASGVPGLRRAVAEDERHLRFVASERGH